MVHVAPLITLHAQHGIVTQAYASLAPTTRHPTGGPLKPVLERIASDLAAETGVQVDASGVLLLWIMTREGVCITSSSSEERIVKMAALERVRDLTDAEMGEIDRAGSRVHFRAWVSVVNLRWPGAVADTY
jgi:diketogulonate reductase-like aldo/keto reductase